VSPKPRSLWPAVLVVAIVAGAIWLVWVVWRSPHRSDLATFGAFAAAVVTIAAGQIAWAKNIGVRRHSGERQQRALDRVADLLSNAVKDQWTRAALDRRLQPEPIAVRWARPSRPFAGPVSAAADSRQFPPLPGLTAARRRDLRTGQLWDLHAVYGGLGSGRLMIVGTPGSGKSGAAVLLVLAALRHREQAPEKDRPLVPVPVMFTLHGWDPNTQRIEDWLASRLQQTYPLFAGQGGADGTRLVRAGRVAVILDGLDEIAAKLRPVVLQALSQQAAFRVVLLARSAEIAAAARHGLLEGAVALELQGIDPPAAADYLMRVQLDPAPRGWRELVGRLRQAPDSPIAKALSSPLALTLVRDTYRSGDDVRELLNFCDAARHGVLREDIEDHLLDRVLPAAYAPRPGEPAPRYDLQAAQHALGYIAARMNQDSTRDLAWWRIPAWASAAPRVIATGLVVGLAVGLGGFGVGLAAGLGAWRGAGIGVGLVFGLLVGLIAGHRSETPQRIGPPRWRQVFSRPVLAVGLVVGLGVGLVAGLVMGSVAGLAVGLGGWLGGGLVDGLVFGLSRTAADNASPLTPRASWQRDQAFGLLTGLVGGLVAGLVVGLAAGLVAGLWAGLVAGLMVGVVFGLVSGLTYPKTWAASLAFAQLARGRHTPIRLMRFLEDARKRDVLRTVGPVYQFRHARLQDRLADQARTATHPDQQTIGAALQGFGKTDIKSQQRASRHRRQQPL
jgi:hypothetical protein